MKFNGLLYEAEFVPDGNDPSGLACDVTYECYLKTVDSSDQCVYKCKIANSPPPQTKKGTDPGFDCEDFKNVADLRNHAIYFSTEPDPCTGCPSPNSITTTVFWDRPGKNCSISKCHASCKKKDPAYCAILPRASLRRTCKLLMKANLENCKDLCNIACKKK